MWQCAECGATCEDKFSACWNCQAEREDILPEGEPSMDENVATKNRAAAPEESTAVSCLRCGSALVYDGTMRFQHSSLWLTGELNFLDKHLELYVCRRCGHVELFIPDSVAK